MGQFRVCGILSALVKLWVQYLGMKFTAQKDGNPAQSRENSMQFMVVELVLEIEEWMKSIGYIDYSSALMHIALMIM